MNFRSIFGLLLFIALIGSNHKTFAQCAGAQSITVTPPFPPSGDCPPGQVYQFCYTMVGYNENGANWLDGFEIQYSGGWAPGSLNPLGPPANCNGGTGNWMWDLSVTGTSTGQTNGPGYFFDLNPDGNAGNDYGDYQGGGTCTWSFCFELTAGSTPGANLSAGVVALSDGAIGSWNSTACGLNPPPFNSSGCIIGIPCGTISSSVVQHETCPGDGNGEATGSMTNGTPPYTYSWNTVPVQTTQNATGLTAGSYTISITDATGCVETSSVTVNTGTAEDGTINNANATNTFCLSDAAVQLTTVEAGGTFSGTGVSASGLFTPANAGTGTHTISYTTSGPCPDTQTLSITVIQDADATITDPFDPANPTNTLCVNDPAVQLNTVSVGGNWTGPGVSLTGIFNPLTAGIGVHNITYDIPDPCGDNDIITITVSGTTDATINNINPLNELCANDPSAQITTVAPGGTLSGPGVGPTGMFDPAIAGEGVHTVTYEFLGNCPASSTMDITVLHVNDATINPINATNIICIDGAPVQLTSVDPGGTWSGTGISATGLFNPSTAGTGVHTITCDIADPCGDNQTMDIEVIEVTFTNAVTDALCFNEASGQINIANETGSAPHLFSIDGGTGTQATGQFPDLLAGNYDLVVTDDNGCSSQPVAVVVNHPTELTVGAIMDQQSNCDQPDGQATALAAGGTMGVGYTYQWSSVPVQNSATAVGLLPQGYDVVATDDNGCTATTAIIVTSTPPISVDIIAISDPLCKGACDGTATAIAGPNAVTGAGETWSWNSAVLNNTANATGLCGDTWYTVTYTDAVGCIATADTVLAEPSLIVVDLSADTNLICIGGIDSLWVSASGGAVGGYNFSWSSFPVDGAINVIGQNQEAAPVVSTTYSVFATDNNNCVSSVELVDVTVHPPLQLDVLRPTSIDSSICPYDFATLDLLPSGGNGNYTIYLMPDLVNPVTLPMTVQPANDSTFTFVLTDDCETPDVEASITINLKEMPQIDFTVVDSVGCQPFKVDFEDLTVPAPANVYWNFGDLNSDIGQPSGSTVSYTYLDEGVYDVTLTAITTEGCTDSLTKPGYIVVNPLPVAFYTADPSYVNLFNARVKFTDFSVENILVWDWTFGDGDGSSIQNPYHIYSDTGLFNVILDVENNFGCHDSVSSKIEIYPDYTMYIPNSFTPNNDGVNDVFKPLGDGFFHKTYSFTIFDRWGEEIFHTANYEIGWDGTFKGAQVEISSFTYQVTAVDLNNFNREHYGHVTLTR